MCPLIAEFACMKSHVTISLFDLNWTYTHENQVLSIFSFFLSTSLLHLER